MLLSALQQLLKMSTFCPYTRCKKVTPSFNCIVNGTLVHAAPSIQQTFLHFINGVQLQLMHSLLDVTPYLVIDWLVVFVSSRPGGMKVGVDCSRNRTLSCADVQVQRWNRLTHSTSWATVAVIGACHGNSHHWSSLPDGQRWGPWD